MGESAELLFRYSVHARVVAGGTEIIRARPKEAYSAPLYSKAQVTPHVGSLDIEIVLMYDILNNVWAKVPNCYSAKESLQKSCKPSGTSSIETKRTNKTKIEERKMQLGSALEFEPHYSKLLNIFAFAGVIGPLFSRAAVCEFKGRTTG